MNHRGHDIAGGENHRPRFDLASVVQLDADRARAGVEAHGFPIEQARTAGHRSPEQSAGQLHRVGICRARGKNSAGTSNPEEVKEPCMVEEFAGQTGAPAKFMLPEQFLAAAARRKIERIPLAHLAGEAELKDQRPQPDDRAQAGKVRA